MEAEKIDQFGAAQPALLDQRLPGFLRRLAEVAEQYLTQAFHRFGVAIERAPSQRPPLNLGLPIRTIANLAYDSKFGLAFEHHVVTAVRQLDQAADSTRAADF